MQAVSQLRTSVLVAVDRPVATNDGARDGDFRKQGLEP